MLISVVNHTGGKLSDEEVQDGIRAVNRQIAHDFLPHWHMGAELRLEVQSARTPTRSPCPSYEATRSFTYGMRLTLTMRSATTTVTRAAYRSDSCSPSS